MTLKQSSDPIPDNNTTAHMMNCNSDDKGITHIYLGDPAKKTEPFRTVLILECDPAINYGQIRVWLEHFQIFGTFDDKTEGPFYSLDYAQPPEFLADLYKDRYDAKKVGTSTIMKKIRQPVPTSESEPAKPALSFGMDALENMRNRLKGGGNIKIT